MGHAVGVNECLMLESHLGGGRERATLGAKGKADKAACSIEKTTGPSRMRGWESLKCSKRLQTKNPSPR